MYEKEVYLDPYSARSDRRHVWVHKCQIFSTHTHTTPSLKNKQLTLMICLLTKVAFGCLSCDW